MAPASAVQESVIGISKIITTKVVANLRKHVNPVYEIAATERMSMPPRGRPRSFDRDAALKSAMEVFWSKGYEGAQLVDLTKAMGISPPSFYAAFGTKEEAFHEAVDLYIRTVGARPMQALERAQTLRAGLRTMIERSIDVALSSDTRGCMLILGVVNSLPETSGASAYLGNARRKTHALLERRIQRAIEEGELPTNSNSAALADFYHGILQAISFQARDGATRAQLRRLIKPALAAISRSEEDKT